jgi:hypothetical protein
MGIHSLTGSHVSYDVAPLKANFFGLVPREAADIQKKTAVFDWLTAVAHWQPLRVRCCPCIMGSVIIPMLAKKKLRPQYNLTPP